MPRISKYKINDKVLLKIYQLFFRVISKLDNQELFFTITDEILSPTEKIMLAKRIAIIYLLIKKLDQRDIVTLLKVSKSTVSIYAYLFFKQKSKTVEILTNMINKEKILGFLEDLIHDFLVNPGVYIGHRKLQWMHEKRKYCRKHGL